MGDILRSSEFICAVCKVNGIDPDNVRRVIIDADGMEQVVSIYVELYASKLTLALHLPGPCAAKVIILEKG